jgi:diguanylate cyclase (GGDEF)-like protein
MRNAPTSPTTVAVILELEDSRSLAGDIAMLPDGQLQISNTEVLDRNDIVSTIIAEGAQGTLKFPTLANPKASGSPVSVLVNSQHGNHLTLDFANPGDSSARYYRDLLRKTLGDDGNGARKSAVNVAPDPERKGTPLQVKLGHKRLLDAIEKHSLDELALALPAFLTDLIGSLMQRAENTFDEEEALNHREAAKIIKGLRADVEEFILNQLSDYFRDLTPPEGDDQLWQYDIGSGANELNVIDLQEFEEFLAIDRMVGVGEDLYKVQLEALTVRMAQLVDADPNKVRVPIHVRQLCRAFQRALLDVQIPGEAFAHVFDYFAKRFIPQLDGFYDPLNELLAKNDIRPNLEHEIQNHGFILERNKPYARPQRQSGRQESQAAEPSVGRDETIDQFHRKLGEQLTGAFGQSSADALYRSVVDALNFKREAEGLADGSALSSGTALSGTWEGATIASSEVDQSRLADAQSIARALSSMQRDSRAREAVNEGDSLREYLAANKQTIGGLKDTTGLTAESLNQLDMVDNLFGTIRSHIDVNADLKPALGNLQIPLAKLALLDPQFFLDYTHAARAVVDKLSQLASSANFPNKALESRINAIVQDIVSDYESDDAVFSVALEKIDRLVSQQERALSRNIERVVRTQEGQETLAHARRAVGYMINSSLDGNLAPRVLIDLIEHGWRDLLVLTHVKQGADSDAWAEQTKTLETLNRWLTQLHRGEVSDEQNIQRSLEVETLLELIGQQISSALPTHVAHEPVLEELGRIFAGEAAVDMAQVSPALANLDPEPAQVRAKIDDLPRLRRWVRRVEQLTEGNWLAYRDKQNKKKRMQLAWISPARDRYIFVNERGQKVADLSAIQLARQLSRGVKPPAPADKLNVVDQSMYHTLEHVQKTLSFARNHDSLTKLINKETFIDQMGRALRHSQRKRSSHAVLYINIDQFHLVNDIYDRVVGDQVLHEFAKLLAQLHGKKSSSARLQDDEFGVLLLDRTLDQAMEIAEKVRSDIAASSMDIEGESVSFTVSIGVSEIVEYGPAVEETLDAARTAMLHAKNEGRNKVVRYEEDRTLETRYRHERDSVREDLEKALATERFVLRAQPIVQTSVSNSEDKTLHYELLLGLANPDGTLSSPQEFIQSAERYGFMHLVDRWVVREAFAWISELMDKQKVVPHLAINLSGSSVTDDSFLEYLLEQISEFGVGTSRLCFEITETGTISNLVKAADFVRAFRNIGCKFSIDDFGTGLASHNYLRELPVDYVKIDGSFVTGIHRNRSDYAMARSINDLAHFLGQETIAESVEHDEIVVKLEEIGVDYLQGWGVGKPKPLSEVTADLSNLEK